ncbi:MAG: amidohydrolase family protein [Candidatus Thorarchaeota archaeon]
MRVIDVHTHTWSRDIISKRDLETRRTVAEKLGVEPVLDSTIDSLREAMNTGGVERSVVLPIDSAFHQKMPLSLTEKTDWHANEVANNPNIISFVGLDPRRGEAGLKELERAVKEKGCRGWKMYPPNGFYPDDKEFDPYYKLCVDLNIPIIIHQGFTPRHKHVKYARPVYVDRVAADFPDLKIVLAHVGFPWQDETLMIAAKNPNVSVDVSGWQVFASSVPMKVYHMIGDAKILRVFPNRVLFGSDFPLFEYTMPLKKWVDFFAGLQIPSELVDQGYKQVREDEIEKVMWKNAARIIFGETP